MFRVPILEPHLVEDGSLVLRKLSILQVPTHVGSKLLCCWMKIIIILSRYVVAAVHDHPSVVAALRGNTHTHTCDAEGWTVISENLSLHFHAAFHKAAYIPTSPIVSIVLP